MGGLSPQARFLRHTRIIVITNTSNSIVSPRLQLERVDESNTTCLKIQLHIWLKIYLEHRAIFYFAIRENAMSKKLSEEPKE